MTYFSKVHLLAAHVLLRRAGPVEVTFHITRRKLHQIGDRSLDNKKLRRNSRYFLFFKKMLPFLHSISPVLAISQDLKMSARICYKSPKQENP